MKKINQQNDSRRARGLAKRQIKPLLKLVQGRGWKARAHPDVLKRHGLWQGRQS